MQVDARALVGTGRALLKEVSRDDVSGMAAELTYRMLLALFPFFIFLAALGGFVADAFQVEDPTEEIMAELRKSLPADASSVIEDELRSVLESRNAGLLSVGIIGAIWAASSAMGTIMKALNRAYDVQESRPLYKKYPVAIGLTILAGSFFVGAFAALIVGQVAAARVSEALGLGDSGTIVSLVRFPFVILLLAVATAFLYWAAPNIRLPFRWVTPGSAVFIAGWIAMTFAFGLYVSNFGSYNSTYGTLGGVVILMVWLYLTNFIFLIGAELNAILEATVEGERPVPGERREEGTIRGRQVQRESPEEERTEVPSRR